ncbi:MAG: protoporphyrinogen/coproporphyrinogen oxidase [Bacteriovoracaceae bacterium]
MKRVIGKIDPSDKHVSIWGAGFSGLVLGYYLKSEGYKVTIYEKSNKVGGKIQTKKVEGGFVEKGPNALYLNADGLELLKELKLEPLPAQKKIKRLLMVNGKPKRPFQMGLLTKLGANVYKKPPLITDGLTVAEFFRPLLGEEKVNRFISPALSGIYAAPSEQLHFRSIFDQVGTKAQFESYFDFFKHMLRYQKAQPKLEVSGSVSFEGGMQTLVNRLADVLKNDIKLNTKEHFRLKNNTIICTDAPTAAQLLKEARPEIARELERIRYTELSSVTVFLKREIRPLNKAFGVLIPQETGFNAFGILNNKAIFPANNENLLSYTLISRKKLSEDEILSDLRQLFPEIGKEDIDHTENNYWEKALPLYDLQRFLAVKKLHQMARKEPNLAIFGNYVAGISLREMISAAKVFAKDPGNYPETR